ncbi:MAG: carboxypeptidase-like regulatory domain-containing protein [Cryomorphaceae bacterium]
MTKSSISLFIGIIFALTVFGQESLSGVVYDGETLKPLAKATVRIGNRNMKTDASGVFSIPLKKDKELEVYAAGFHDYHRDPVDFFDQKGISIYLVPKLKLKGIKVSAEAVGVYEPNFEYLFDFEFVNNLLVVGSYLNRDIGDHNSESTLQNCALSLFDRGELVHRTLIPDFPQRFRRSAFGQLYVQGMDYAIRVNEERGKLSYSDFDFKAYRTQVVPWTVAFSNSAFRVKIVRELPQVVHYCHRTDDDTLNIVRIARNEAYFKNTAADYSMLSKKQKDLALALSDEHGFDPQVYASFIRSTENEANYHMRPNFNGGVTRDLRPPYTPVYKSGDQAVIVDALNEIIYTHLPTGEAVDSVLFQVDLDGEQLIKFEQDRISQLLYTIHERKGAYLIRELDPETGALGNPMKIAFPYPEKLKIYNGNAFYIRHDVDEQFKHLYKESLNFN